MGVFNKKMNKEGAMAGMIVGIVFVAAYITYFKYINPAMNNKDGWWLGISPEGIGTVGAALNFIVMYVVSKFTKEPPQEIQELVANLRYPGKLPPAQSH
jgi:cation/acetate symporter